MNQFATIRGLHRQAEHVDSYVSSILDPSHAEKTKLADGGLAWAPGSGPVAELAMAVPTPARWAGQSFPPPSMNIVPKIPRRDGRCPAGWFLPLVSGVTMAICSALPLCGSTVNQPSFGDLVQQADYIVHATVKSVTAEWKIDGQNRHIMTKVELDVNEVVAGNPPQPLVLTLLGGRIGDQELRVEGAPRFKVGDEDILFIHGNGQQFTPLVAMQYGRYPIKHDAATGAAYVTRANGVPLYGEQEVILPPGAASALKASQPGALPLSPADFKKLIRTCRQEAATATP